MNKTEIYTNNYCPWCYRAKSLFDAVGAEYQEYEVSYDERRFNEMINRSSRYTVPRIFINDVAIGGSDELFELADNGALRALLQDHREELKNAA